MASQNNKEEMQVGPDELILNMLTIHHTTNYNIGTFI